LKGDRRSVALLFIHDGEQERPLYHNPFICDIWDIKRG
jgi:hypothetical protein